MPPPPTSPAGAAPATARRRLSEVILEAFFLACEAGALDLAAELFRACEVAVRRFAQDVAERRRGEEALILAFEHLWFLRAGRAEPSGAVALA